MAIKNPTYLIISHKSSHHTFFRVCPENWVALHPVVIKSQFWWVISPILRSQACRIICSSEVPQSQVAQLHAAVWGAQHQRGDGNVQREIPERNGHFNGKTWNFIGDLALPRLGCWRVTYVKHVGPRVLDIPAFPHRIS